jgi:hypothetical protein
VLALDLSLQAFVASSGARMCVVWLGQSPRVPTLSTLLFFGCGLSRREEVKPYSPLPPVITGFSLVNFVVSRREEQFFFKLSDVYYI